MKVARNQFYSSPIRALAGLIKCKCCDLTIELISAKGGEYYGCYNAKGECCDNKQWLSRGQVGAIILNDLKEKFLTAESLKSMDGLAFRGALRAIEQRIMPYYMLEQSNITSLYHVVHTSIQTIALLEEEYISRL